MFATVIGILFAREGCAQGTGFTRTLVRGGEHLVVVAYTHTHTHKHSQKQTNKQTNTQTLTQTNKHSHRHSHKQKNTHTNKQTPDNERE